MLLSRRAGRPRSSASSATCIRRSSATSSRRWAARSRAIRSSAACSRKRSPRRTLATTTLLSRRSTAICARRVHEVDPPDADDRRSGRARAARRTSVSSPGQFYRLQNFETLALRRDGTRGSRWKASRSPARGSIAKKDWSRRSCSRWAARPTCARMLKPGEPVCSWGRPARRPRSRRRDRRCSSAAASATRCCSRSARRCAAAGIEGALLRRLQEACRPLQASTRSSAAPTSVDLVLRRGARLRAAPSAGPRFRRQHRAGDARLRERRARRAGRSRCRRADRIIAIGSDRMMARGRAGAARRARAVPEAGPRGDRLDQLADAMHDEGDLRAVPAAARRSGDRQDDATSSPASTRTSRSTRSISPRSLSACARTRCRRSSRRSGSTIAWSSSTSGRCSGCDRCRRGSQA